MLLERSLIQEALTFLIFEIINPDAGPKTKSTMENGNCILPVVIGSSPKPTGIGVWIKIGIVWKTINIDIPIIIMTRVENSIV